MTTRVQIGARIRDARTAARLSQQALADATGIIRGAITDIETGKRNVTATELVTLAAALGCGIGRLLGTEPVDIADAYTAGHLDGWHACAEAMHAAAGTRAWTLPTTDQIKMRMSPCRAEDAATPNPSAQEQT